MARPARLLILGGTGEAAALAREAVDRPGLHVITSLAGRTRNPAQIAGEIRSGGFGGAQGLADYLRAARIDLVIDATHSFAAVISRHAAEACAAVGLPRVHLLRPAWIGQDGDDWIEVDDLDAAAAALPDAGRRAFLTIGRNELARFAGVRDVWFLVRVIDPLAGPQPLANCEVIEDRPPFAERAENALMATHGIDVVVSKNAGGDATYAKIATARARGLPVVMVRRPAPPGGPLATSVAEALAWLDAEIGRR